MNKTPIAERLSIVVYGLRNSGKSSLVNNMLETESSIVSDRPGTTTDPVVRSIEMGPLGPVSVTDTAGFDDDEGYLGALRVKRTNLSLENADIVVYVTRGDSPPEPEEVTLMKDLYASGKPVLVVLSFADLLVCSEKRSFAPAFRKIQVDNISRKGMEDLNVALQGFSDQLEREISPLEGLVQPGEMVLLVTPIDASAPKARMILPQVEIIRDVLDKDCFMSVTQVARLGECYRSTIERPAMVITDSQAFGQVAEIIPKDQLLTSFSIVFARKKGDLAFFVEGVQRLGEFPDSGKVLILESCKHHNMYDDIGRVKIPNFFRKKVCSSATFEVLQDVPPMEKLKEFSYVINCAGCMTTRNNMMRRIALLREAGIPGTNYGVFLAWANNLLPRALEPFPLEHALYNSFKKKS